MPQEFQGKLKYFKGMEQILATHDRETQIGRSLFTHSANVVSAWGTPRENSDVAARYDQHIKVRGVCTMLRMTVIVFMRMESEIDEL